MSIGAINWAWDVPDIPPVTKLVLMGLADSHNTRADRAWPSIRQIAERCNISRATVQRHLKALEEMGLVKTEKRLRDDGGQTSNLYILSMKGGPQSDTGGHQDCDEGGASIVIPPEEPLDEPLIDPPIGPPKGTRSKQIGDWLPSDEDRAKAVKFWAGKARQDIDVAEQIDAFVDYHLSKGSRMKDWPRAWGTWFRNAVQFSHRPKGQATPLKSDTLTRAKWTPDDWRRNYPPEDKFWAEWVRNNHRQSIPRELRQEYGISP